MELRNVEMEVCRIRLILTHFYMSFLLSAELLESATQVKAWHNSAIAGMNQAKSAYISLATQLESMKSNTDYSEDDCKAVEEMLVSIVELAKSLIHTGNENIISPELPTK